MNKDDQIRELQAEVERLKSYCDRLRTAALNAISMMPGGNAKADLRDAYDETPAQCLAAHDAEVIERAADYASSEVDECTPSGDYDCVLREYAKMIRKQAKEANDFAESEIKRFQENQRAKESQS